MKGFEQLTMDDLLPEKNGRFRLKGTHGTTQRGRNTTRAAVPSANVEPALCDEQMETAGITPLDTRSHIHLHSRRHRLADPDGLSGKAVIDGLRRANILIDDSVKYIDYPTQTQEKIKKSEPEETIITITAIGQL